MSCTENRQRRNSNKRVKTDTYPNLHPRRLTDNLRTVPKHRARPNTTCSPPNPKCNPNVSLKSRLTKNLMLFMHQELFSLSDKRNFSEYKRKEAKKRLRSLPEAFLAKAPRLSSFLGQLQSLLRGIVR